MTSSSTRVAAATSSAGRPSQIGAVPVVIVACVAVVSSRPAEVSRPSVEQAAVGQFADEIDGIGEVSTVGHGGCQAVGVDAAVEPAGQPQGHPLRLGEPGPLEVTVKQGVEGLLGLADELGAERSGHASSPEIVGLPNDSVFVGATNNPRRLSLCQR